MKSTIPTFKRFLSESIIDPMQKTLDRGVFVNPEEDEATLDPMIKAQIRSAIRQFETICPVKTYYLVGSILSKRYNRRSDLDITVEISKDDADEETQDALYAMLDKINGQMAGGSTHPINYHFNFVDEDEDLTDNFDSIYDLGSDEWTKHSEDRYIDPSEFMDEFDERIREIDLNAMEIRRDIVDIDLLKDYSKDEIEGLVQMVEDKLDDIEDNIEEMVDSEEEVAELRREGFSDITPEELKELGSKNALPINIVYKLMERYYYLDLIKKLKSILDEDDEIEEEDIPRIKSAFREFDSDLYDGVSDAIDGESTK